MPGEHQSAAAENADELEQGKRELEAWETEQASDRESDGETE
jgi:hypothetical protein